MYSLEKRLGKAGGTFKVILKLVSKTMEKSIEIPQKSKNRSTI